MKHIEIFTICAEKVEETPKIPNPQKRSTWKTTEMCRRKLLSSFFFIILLVSFLKKKRCTRKKWKCAAANCFYLNPGRGTLFPQITFTDYCRFCTARSTNVNFAHFLQESRNNATLQPVIDFDLMSLLHMFKKILL